MEEIFKERKKLVLIYILIIASIILNIFVIPRYLAVYWNILNVVLWIMIFFLARKVSNQHNRFKGKKDKITTTFIIVAVYLMLYYLSGLFFGYKKSPYDHSIFGLLYNFIFYIMVILLQEYTRSRLINNTRSNLGYALITILLILVSYNYTMVYKSFETGENIFKFFASIAFST